MKKYLIPAVLVLAVAAVALIILNEHIYQEKQAPAEPVLPTEDVVLSGYITNVDSSEMAFDGPARIAFLTSAGEIANVALPSMGMSLCAAKDRLADLSEMTVGRVIEVRGQLTEEGIVPCAKPEHYARVYEEVLAPELGIEFSYLVAPAGYTQFSPDQPMSIDPDFVEGFIYLATADSVAMADSTVPREGPPTMQIRVYRNPDGLSALQWARSHPLETNIELAFGAPQPVMVEHVSAIRYKADGLYASDVYVAAHGDFMYVLTGAYMDQKDAIVKDFAELLSSVVFLELDEYPAPTRVQSGTVTLGFGETGTVGQVRITPQALLEDSRCPSDVVCIQAGTVRVSAELVSALGTATAEFMLNTPITTEAEEIILTGVAPDTESTTAIDDSEYRFTFSIEPRN